MKQLGIVWTLLLVLASQLAFAQDVYRKPVLEQKGSWSVIMVPDIQNYVNGAETSPSWI
ncbi:hypothetical protein LWM68_22395 [Niabella sp. W65]|nr:hypothetical protein [Niabella sp. W65]MCH7365267.1 hypothetical protein [Niabella sp. W65]ULT41066.1 hypothetical protein KRR40_41280 [Niabella sp. I65]